MVTFANQEYDLRSEDLLVYGDFNSPWCYLAARRLAALATCGVRVDWRAVEHRPGGADREDEPSPGFGEVLLEIEAVEAGLLAEEWFPYALAGFVPETRAAVCAYAQAYQLGHGALAREVLFESLWLHALDLNDGQVVHTVVLDALRSRSPATGPASWRPTGAGQEQVVTEQAQRLCAEWEVEWRTLGTSELPALVTASQVPLFGADALAWLGAKLLREGVDVALVPERLAPTTNRESRIYG